MADTETGDNHAVFAYEVMQDQFIKNVVHLDGLEL